jgi:hypothetical protein
MEVRQVGDPKAVECRGKTGKRQLEHRGAEPTGFEPSVGEHAQDED